MDQEGLALLNVLFPKGHPNQSEGVLNEYINKLGTYRSEDLNREPSRLRDEKSTILEHTQELATSNYKTFIQTADCSRQLFSQFNHIGQSVDTLLENIPKFHDKCELFRSTSNGINNTRKLNSVTLSKNAQILEILELPQLMDSFIKDDLYEDAFELVSYVRRLHQKHADIPVLENIMLDVERLWLVMLHQLLAQLGMDIQLPACLQIIGYLRRMEAFSEAELRLKFLQARDAWLRHCLQAIPNKSKDSANHHLSKTIEISRVQLFNIVTQYRAIFNDDEHTSVGAQSNNSHQHCILFSWINVKISDFLTTLKHDLELIEWGGVDSILGQCMYFGLSFSKVGCDFRPMMVPIFTKAIKAQFIGHVALATHEYQLNLERFTLINKSYSKMMWRQSANATECAPPETLLEFYPFAEYLNNMLTGLNRLRLCGGVVSAVVSAVVGCVQDSLLVVSGGILRLYAQEHQAFTPQARDTFTRLCMAYTDHLVPHIQKALHILFPQHSLAAQLGVSLHDTHTLQTLTLHRDKLLESIQHLLPTKIDPPSISTTSL